MNRFLVVSLAVLMMVPAWGLPARAVNSDQSNTAAESAQYTPPESGLFLVFNQNGTEDGAAARMSDELQVAGVEEVHNYGDARLVTIADPSLLSAESRALLTSVENSDRISFRTWGSPSDIVSISESTEYHVVAFSGPVDDAWMARLDAMGVQVVDTAAPYGLVVRANARALESIATLRTTAGHNAVRGIQPVPVEARIDLTLLGIAEGTIALNDVVGLRRSDDQRMVVHVVAYAGENPRRIRRLVNQYARPAVGQEGFGYPDAYVIEGPEIWSILQNIDGVSYIEPIFERRLMNNLAAKSNVQAIEDVWNLGYTGADVDVNHNDGGVDTTHPDFPAGVITATAGKMSGTDNGHGTHTAGSVVSRGLGGTSPVNNSGCGDLITGFSTVRGMAYGARLNSNNLFDPGTTGKTTEDTMMKYAQDNGSELSTNSWGYTTDKTYNSGAATIDRAVRDADTTEAGQQALCILFAAGNSGSGASTVSAPGVAKNAITVGASHNVRCGSYTSGNPGTFTGNLNTVVDFSGRGPSQGRIKPDIVATGANVLSTGSRDSLADWGGWDQTWTGSNYALLPGTSMATPIVAGATAVFFQYYKATQGGSFPSPALAKAALINGATPMSGGTTSYTLQNTSTGTYAQGWGRLNLKNTVQGPAGGTIKFVDQAATGLTTGGSTSRQITVNSSSVPLKITAVWTDPEASAGSTAPLKNNLNLVVTSPTGVVYRGNQFTGVWSTANPTASDTVNNVENVYVQSPTTGTWTIQVSAVSVTTNVAGKTGQDFALVYSGNLTDGGGCSYSISPTSASVAASASTGSVSVTAGAGCAWTATSNASWITVTSGASGTGNGSVGYSVAANTGAARNGTVTIAGQTFTVSQAAGTTGCSSGNSAITVGAAASSGSLATTDCTSTVRTTGTFYYDNFTFSATAGTAYTITLNSSAFDAFVYLLNGSTVLASDDDGNGGTNSKIVYTPTTSGTLTIHCTSYSASATGAYTVQVTGGTTPPPTELVTNGGFETGAMSPWVAATYSTVTSGSPQAGTYKAQMLGRGTTTSTNFYQALAGFNGTSKTLRFYLKMSSAEGTTTAYDYLYVRLKNTSGTTVSTLATYSNKNKTTYAGWTLVTLTVPSTALANYRISFDGTEDTSLQTTFYIDGVSVQ